MTCKESHGYKLGDTKVISIPFADDFDLISNHVKKHQNLMLDIQKKAESIGLNFKASKCRSLSIQGGKVTASSPPEYREYKGDTVLGGQITLDLVAAHNIDFSNDKVSLSDLKPNTDPDSSVKVRCH